jgi:hypothetical protein
MGNGNGSLSGRSRRRVMHIIYNVLGLAVTLGTCGLMFALTFA